MKLVMMSFVLGLLCVFALGAQIQTATAAPKPICKLQNVEGKTNGPKMKCKCPKGYKLQKTSNTCKKK